MTGLIRFACNDGISTISLRGIKCRGKLIRKKGLLHFVRNGGVATMSLRGTQCRSNPFIKMRLYHNKVETRSDTFRSAYIKYQKTLIQDYLRRKLYTNSLVQNQKHTL